MRPKLLRMKGFGAFREKTVVDFTDVELAAFVGATGSGKSTIIDGITFALFGVVARYDDRRAVAPVINMRTPEARVSFEFEVGDVSYTAVRVVKRTNNGATTKEARLERAGLADNNEVDVLASRASEMDQAVEQVLGLDFDRFTKTVLLPQGRFAAFLHDPPADRQELLRELLDLGIYRRMGSRARQRANTASDQLAVLVPKLETEVPSEKRIAQLAEAKASMETAQVALEGHLKNLERSDEAVTVARKQVHDFELLLLAVAGVTVPKQALELGDELHQATTALEALEESLTQATDAARAAEQAQKEGPNIETCRLLIKRHQELSGLTETLTVQETALADAENHESKCRAALQQAEQSFDERLERLDQVKADNEAEALRDRLVEGEPCPVCLQTVDELPEHDLDVNLEEARRDYRQAEETKTEHEKALNSAGNALAKAEATLKASRAQHDRLAEDLAGEPTEADLERDIALAEQLAEKCKAARHAEQEADDAQRTARSAREGLAEKERQAQAAFDRTRDGLAGLQPPARQESLVQSWQALATWAARLAEDLVPEIAKAQDIVDESQKRQATHTEAARAVCVPYFDPVAADPQRWLVNMATEVEQAKNTHQQARQKRQDMAELEAQVEALRDEELVARELGRVLQTGGFEKWLLEGAVGTLIENASERLLQLSNQRYSFAAGGTEFDICDHDNADLVRQAKSLSGGETFLASLALALALSDSHAELASEGAPGLDSLFLDEGFGTLDPETLDVTAAAIEELGATGRMVAIITHIRELAERVPVRFEVASKSTTSTVEKVFA